MKGKRRFCGGVRPPTQQDISKGVPASGSNNDNEPLVVVPNQVKLWTRRRGRFIVDSDGERIEESSGVWIGINGTVLMCETEAITPVKKTETMEKQRSHPFVCIPMFKQVEHTQRQGLQVQESCGEKELISTHTVVQIEALKREVKSPFSPEVVLGKEACPKIDPETALNKFHCAHEPFEDRYPEIRCTKKHNKCFKSWKFKFKRRNMGKERQKKHVQYTASQEEHRGCWLQRRKEKQFLKSCQWKYKSEMTKLTLHDQFLCFEMVNSERVDWLQNITSPLLLKYKVQMGCTHVKKNKGMCYVLKNSSDALVSISGKGDAGLIKRSDVSLRNKEIGVSRGTLCSRRQFLARRTDHTVQKERHHQEKLYVAGSFKFTQRSYAPEKLNDLPLNQLGCYFAVVVKEDYFAVWCWGQNRSRRNQCLKVRKNRHKRFYEK
ncbi:hypothetical protein F2Q69_00015337 [Brassica cretica]|uniref:Uncharacterized protein n=1 Tax=Brassica cretica TaxID=69181 RepID=A0A8S9R2Q6_BRACR|nr:hypothetical protein F2Q69_00015337 [Brassica cretica]